MFRLKLQKKSGRTKKSKEEGELAKQLKGTVERICQNTRQM